MTVAAARTRPDAARLGSTAMRDESDGERAMQVRVVSRSQLVSERDEDAILEADADLASRGGRADDDA